MRAIFIFDTEILDRLENKSDKRLVFIHQQLEKINAELQKIGSRLDTYYGKPLDVWKKICLETKVSGVFTNHD